MPTDLKYPVGYFAPTVMPLTVIRPAPPEAVVGFFSPDYYGYVGRETQIRITMQGGAYPYAFIIDSAPAGATISNDPTDKQNYSVLKFTPTENGTSTIQIRAYDQDGTQKTLRWTFTTSTDWCVFADPVAGVDSPSSGSFANPFKSIYYARTNTTGGKALILKNGTYTDTELGVTLNTSSINSVLAWQSRQAIVDLVGNVQTSPSILFYINSSHMLAQGIVFRNPPSSVDNPRLFSGDSATNYVYQDDCLFEINGRLGTVNTDNVSCFFLGATSRSYIAQTRCEFDGFAGAANGWSAFDWYAVRYGKFECNRIRNQVSSTTSAGMIWLKGTFNRDIDVHNNEFETAMSGSLIDVFMANVGDGEGVTGNMDVAFNLIRCTGTGVSGIVIARASQWGTRLPVWTRRNTIINGVIYVMTFGTGYQYPVTLTSSSDVIQSTIASTDPYKVIVINNNDAAGVYRPLSYRPNLTASVTDFECHANSGVVDSNGILIGAYASYRGRRGHEIRKTGV
jgi:hypothetical protein